MTCSSGESTLAAFFSYVDSNSHLARMSRSTDRSVALLERIAKGKPQGLMELAISAGLDKSTAARLLANLVERQLVVRDQATRKYAVGPALLALAAVTIRKSDLNTVAAPYLSELRDLTEETSSLHIRLDGDRVCIGGFESRHVVRRVVGVGETSPIWAGPSGKVLLAFSPPSTIEGPVSDAISEGVDGPWLRQRLLEIRRVGYMAAVGDRTPEAGAVSAPIFDHSGLAAALTVAGPGSRWTLARMEGFAPRLLAMAAKISTSLGAVRYQEYTA